MKTEAYKLLDKLNPSFRLKVQSWLGEVNLKQNVIFLTETWRSEERQKELLAAGLSQTTHSNHQDGLAVDIGFYGPELYPEDGKKWRKVADIAKKHGIDWGYDLWKWDKPHFQDNNNYFTNNKNMSKYTELMNNALKEAGITEPLFDKHEGTGTLTEQETKELIEIAFCRFIKKYNIKIK